MGVIAVALVAVVAVVVVAFALGGGHPVAAPSGAGSSSVGPSTSASGSNGSAAPPPPGLEIRLNTVAELDAATGRVLHDYSLPPGSDPGSIAFSGGRVWVVNNGDGTISVIDPKTGTVETHGGVQSPCLLSPAGDGGVWVSSCTGDLITHIDPSTLTPDPPIHVEAPGEVAEADGSLWVVSRRSVNGAYGTQDVVERLDPSDGRILKTIAVGENAADITVVSGVLWGTSVDSNDVWRIDPATDRRSLLLPGQFDRPVHIANGPAGIWVTDATHQNKIAPDGRRVDLQSPEYGETVVAGYAVWLVDGTGQFVGRPEEWTATQQITRVDFATGQTMQRFKAPYATDAVAGDGAIWVSAGPIRSCQGPCSGHGDSTTG